ncbi:MAG: hypothetical protein Q8M15_05165 [Bacteroidota bacterium]|nr:hypothetical protein [Bacteroidota bacterium]
MDTKQMEEQVKKFAADWQKSIEELKMQFSLGKMDAADAFEKQKDTMRNMVVNMKEQLDKATDIAEEKGAELKAKLEELKVQLALGKAEGTDAFEMQKKKIELAMHEVYVEGKKIFNDNYTQLLQLFDNNAQAFKTGLEIVKLQFSLGKMEAKEEAENARKEIQEKIHELGEHFKATQQTAMQNMEAFNKQMKEGFEKMKTFAEGWMKK